MSAHTIAHDNCAHLDVGDDFHYEEAMHVFNELDKLIKYVNLNGSIGVDENGKISFVAREHSAQSDPEWLEADVVHLGKNEFLFPGFIGECLFRLALL